MAITDHFERKLDDKNRLTIPVELRHEFGDGEVVVTRGFGKYLHIYPKNVWDEQMEPKLKGDILSEEVANLNVKFRTGRTVSKMDTKQGRITIEQHLLEFADIDKAVVAVRSGEFWRVTAKEHFE